MSKPFGKPHGDTLERQLTFCRADGTDTNGVPESQDFPATLLAAITKVYPPETPQYSFKRFPPRHRKGQSGKIHLSTLAPRGLALTLMAHLWGIRR